MSPEEITVAFFQGEETVDGGADLPTHIPVVKRACEDDHVAVPYCRINLIHIILLDAGTCFAAVASETAFAAVDIHAVQEEFGYSVASTLSAFGERFDQGGSVAGFAGTSV